jgi:hypothetical protein
MCVHVHSVMSAIIFQPDRWYVKHVPQQTAHTAQIMSALNAFLASTYPLVHAFQLFSPTVSFSPPQLPANNAMILIILVLTTYVTCVSKTVPNVKEESTVSNVT